MYIKDVHDYGCTEHKPAEEYLEKRTKEKVKSVVEDIIDGEFSRLEDYANEHISDLAAGRAERFLERVLKGDEDAAMSLLGDRNGGSRYKRGGFIGDEGKPWASLNNGRLFETSGLELRRKIVESHADLLVSERIKDLESAVEGLTLQVKELEQEKEGLYQRFHG